MALADTIELARRRAQAEAWDKGEAEVASRLLMAEKFPAPPDIDEATRQELQPFIAFSTRASVRYCPAKSYVVAAYVLEQAATGASTEKLLRSLDAIAALHDKFNLANPTATWAARTALESVIQTDPPRSWTKAEKESFVQLPIEVKAAIARREQDRETKLRQTQNELAELKKRQNQTAPDAKPVTETKKEKELNHG